MASHRKPRQTTALHREARQATAKNTANQGMHDTVSHDKPRQGIARHSKPRPGTASHGKPRKPWQATANQTAANHGIARQGTALTDDEELIAQKYWNHGKNGHDSTTGQSLSRK
jgi:hypothetical protein